MMARREINREYFVEIWRMKDFISHLPHNTCVCSQHNEPVSIRESEFLPNPGTTAPFAKAALVGCCDDAIDKVINADRTRNL